MHNILYVYKSTMLSYYMILSYSIKVHGYRCADTDDSLICDRFRADEVDGYIFVSGVPRPTTMLRRRLHHRRFAFRFSARSRRRETSNNNNNINDNDMGKRRPCSECVPRPSVLPR